MAEDVGSLVVRVAMENSSFKEGIQNLNRSMRLVQSEFKNATSGLKDHGKGLDGLKAKQEMLGKSVDVQSKLVQKYKDKLKESKDTLSKNAEAQANLKEKVDNAKRAYEESKNTLGENNEKTKELKSSYEELSAEYKQNEEIIRNNSRAVDNNAIRLNNAQSRLNTMQRELGETTAEVDRQSSRWHALSQRLETVGNRFRKVGEKMGAIGKEMTLKLTTPIAGIGVAASKIGMDFEASMSNVSALSGNTGEDLKKLEKAARDAGASTSKSAKDAADALGYMALAGYDNKQMMEALMPVLRLSEAGNLELARTSDLVTDSLSSLGKSTKDLPVYLDQVAKTAASSNTNIDALMEALIVCGGTVKNLNTPLDEANTLLGTLANRGIKGSEAGNSFNSILINLTSGAGQAGEAMSKLGLSAFDSKGKFKGITNVLLELKEKTKNMTEEQRNMYLAMIGGKTQITTLQALLSGVGEEYGELRGKVNDSNGALDKMAKTMQDNNKGSITALKSALEELGIKIYDVLKPAIASIVDKLKEWTNKLNNLTPAQQKNIVKIAGMVAAIGPLLIIGGKLLTGIGKIVTTFSTVTAAMTVAKTGAAAATPVIGLLAKAFTLLNWKVAVIAGAIGGLIYVGKKVHSYFTAEAVPAVDLFADKTELVSNNIKSANGTIKKSYSEVTTKISEETKKQVGAYMELDKGATASLIKMYANRTIITQQKGKELQNTYNQMNQKIKQGINKQHQDRIKGIEKFFANNKSISAAQKAQIITKEKQHNTNMQASQQEFTDKINAIIQRASDKKRQLTASEVKDIEKYQNNMRQNAVGSLSATETESKVIMERIKSYNGKMTKEQASECIKNAEKQRVKTVDEANKQFLETKANIEYMRDVTGSVTAEQADKMIKEAERQKNQTVDIANTQKEGVVNRLKEQNSDVVKEIDTTDGHVKTRWEKISESVTGKANEIKESVVKSFNEQKSKVLNKCNEIKTSVTTKWDEIVNWFDTLPARLKEKAHKMFESMKNGIDEKMTSVKKSATDIGEGIKEAFTELPGKMLTIGSDIMNGLKNGITGKIQDIKTAAGNVAEAITSKIRKVLDINSPSRVMIEIGKYTVEGLAKGIKDNTFLVTKEMIKLANAITGNDIKDKLSLLFGNPLLAINSNMDRLGIDTGDLNENLENQKLILEDAKDKVTILTAKWHTMGKQFTYSSKECLEARKELEDAITSVEKLGREVEETQEKIRKAQETDNKNLATGLNDVFSKIKDALKEHYNDELKMNEENINKQIEANNKWKDNAIKNIDTVYNSKIKALDNELKAHDIAKQDEEDNEKETELKKILSMNYSKKKKEEAQKELDKLLKDREERKYKESIESQKDALKTQYEADKDAVENIAKNNDEYYKNQLDGIKSFYGEKLKEANINAEAEKMIVNNNQNDIVNLLKSYGKDYEIAGASLGERFVKAFENKLYEMADFMNGVTNKLTSSVAVTMPNIPSLAGVGTYSNLSNINNSKTNINNNYGSLLKTENITINGYKDTQAFAQELEFYRQQASKSRGGR